VETGLPFFCFLFKTKSFLFAIEFTQKACLMPAFVVVQFILKEINKLL